MSSHQLPSYNKFFKRQKSKQFNYTGFTQLIGGSTVATIEDCAFCQDKSKLAFPHMVMKALYGKFAASQNYFYSKDINEILQQSRGRATITYKDYQHFDEDDEFLKRVYTLSEYAGKIKMLSEYYKYHYDVPREFMLPTSTNISKYHDKKRRVAYQRITKMLNIQPECEETDKQHDTQHNILQGHKSLECLLDQLNETKTRNHINIIDEQQQQQLQQQHYLVPQHQKTQNTLQSESNTLVEINMRLVELIGGSSSPINPYFPTNTFEDKVQEINLPRPYKDVSRTARLTEPDLVVVRPKLRHQPKTDGQLVTNNNLKTFFQAPDQKHNNINNNNIKLTLLRFSERQPTQKKQSVSPAKMIKIQLNEHLQSHQSSQFYRDKSSHSSRPLPQQDQRSDLLKLLQRNPPTNNSKERQITTQMKTTTTTSTPQQDPIIGQLIKKLQQGNNSNLFQQLIQLTNTEQFRQKAQLKSSTTYQETSNRQQRGISLQQSLIQSGRQTQRSAQQSSSNLSSLLRPSVNTSIGRLKPLTNQSSQSQSKNLKSSRSKRVNSQNMESNPFHLNLDRINITQQKIQTSRQTIRDQRTAYQESIMSSKRVRSRTNNQNSVLLEQQRKVIRNNF